MTASKINQRAGENDAVMGEEVDRLFHLAVDLPASQRRAFVEAHAGGNAALIDEVLELIRHDQQTLFFDQVVEVAADDLADVNSDLSGKRLGPYRLLEPIAHGGMGHVYLAERADDQYQKRVAIKVTRGALGDDALAEAFLTERQIQANLEHVGIARLLDGGMSEKGLPYLVMEYVEGEPIDRFCDGRSLSITQRLKLFLKVCDAVEYAHQQLVVHCDLKMSNILVSATGEAKLVDFGISRLSGRPASTDQALEPRARRLTLRYSSPEQIAGARLTTATDIYSLGVVLYELLISARPYAVNVTGTAAYEQALAAAHYEPVLESPTLAKLPRLRRSELDAILRIAVAKKPEHRYRSVADFADDIRALISGNPVLAHAGSRIYRARKFVTRNAASTGLVLAIVTVIVGSSVVTAHQNNVIRKERDTARLQQQRAEAVTTFITDMFASLDPGQAQGREITVEMAMAKASEKLRASVGVDALDPYVRGSIEQSIASVYLHLGKLDAAAPHVHDALRLLEDNGLTETAVFIEALGDLSALSRAHRDGQADLQASRRAVELSRRVHGDDHEITLAQMNMLAGALNHLGRFDESIAMHQQVYEARLRRFGEHSLQVIQARVNIGITAYWQGNFPLAEQHFEQCLRIAQAIHIERHPLVLNCLAVNGSLMESMGRHEEAEALLGRHIAIAGEVLGLEHPDVLRSMHNLADTYRGRGQLIQAAELFLETLALRQRVLGPDNVETLQTHMKLARVYRLQGAFNEAATHINQAESGMVDKLGAAHPSTLTARNESANLLSAQGQYDAAGREYAELLRLREAAFGPQSGELIETLAHIAMVKLKQAHASQGVAYLQRALTIARQQDGYRQSEVDAIVQHYLDHLKASGETEMWTALKKLATS